MTQPMEAERQEPGQRVELKYCEACGGLQVRPVGSGLNYCLSCEMRQMEERVPLTQPPRRTRKRRPRLPRALVRELHGCAVFQPYVTALEVRA